jgi:hypothetical protein
MKKIAILTEYKTNIVFKTQRYEEASLLMQKKFKEK